MKRENDVEVLDLLAGKGRVRRDLLRRFPGRRIFYHGIDLDLFSKSLQKRPLLKEKWIVTELDLAHPANLERQLKKHLGKKRFDEIHMHSPSFHAAVTGAGQPLLKIVAKLLKPGARFYHVFRWSPIVSGIVWSGDFTRNRAVAQELAKKAGLILDRYGEKHVRDTEWRASQETGTSEQQKVNKAMSDAVMRNTMFPDAQHFFIMRKPK
ncbi:MAG TPA: hypothetical protein VGQ00_00720 [Candidatus Norongarragalinales archaeon]|jgi:hypothetical protein|nr:hypothetical protein [Candidatus Norongarragalinales archaeon]